MEPQKDLLKQLWPFFLSFFAITFLGITVTQYYGRDELHLFFNLNFNYPFFDLFFKHYTDIATNIVLISTVVFIIWKKNLRHLLYLSWVFLTGSLAGNIIKRTFFVDGVRPAYYFQNQNINIHLVEGVESQIPYTFPSGHTLLAVILCFYFCLQTKNRGLQFLLSFLMILVAVGRVYLSKHFVIDTVGGTFIGLFFSVFGYYFIWESKHEILNRKILPLKFKKG